MYDNDDYKVHINITKLEDLNKDEEYKIELEWWIEFSKEFAFENILPEYKLYTTHSIGTIKWNPTLENWQLIDVAMINCHAASICKIYDFGEVIDLEEQNIPVTKSSIRIVEGVGKGIQKILDKYIDKPKVKDLNIIRCSEIGEGYDEEGTIYFWNS
jgi:hypothetical protein